MIKGLKVEHKSYSRIVAADNQQQEQPVPEAEKDNLETKVINFLSENFAVIEPSEISICHTLPTKKDDPPPIIVSLISIKTMSRLLKNLKKT